MDKIKALMIKCGLRPELADKLCESLTKADRERDRQLQEHKKRLDAQYAAQTKEAARVCLEEVEKHKRELAYRVQVFCEARGQAIEESAARQVANKETEALSKLHSIASVVEGMEPNGEPSGALLAENEKLKRRVQALTKEKNAAVENANRNSAIAAKALGRNRALESRITESRNGERTPPPGNTGRLDGSRTRRPSSQPASTRPTLRENQERVRRPAAVPQTSGNGYPGPSDIARAIED